MPSVPGLRKILLELIERGGGSERQMARDASARLGQDVTPRMVRAEGVTSPYRRGQQTAREFLQQTGRELSRALGDVDPNSTGMFYRPGATSRSTQLANDLYERGADRTDIYHETLSQTGRGLMRDYGGRSQWMAELSDAEATLGPRFGDITPDHWPQEPFGQTRNTTLGDMLHHPALYRLKQGAHLPDLDVRLAEDGVGGDSFFRYDTLRPTDRSVHMIGLNFKQQLPEGMDPVAVPLHETQHALDAAAGAYGNGSNLAMGRGSPLTARFIDDYNQRLATAIRETEDAYWKVDDPALRPKIKEHLERLRGIERRRNEATPEETAHAAAYEIYKRSPWEDRARRVMRRHRLTQQQIDSGEHPPWKDRDVPEGELDMGGYYLSDLLDSPHPLAQRLARYLKLGAAAGGLGLSMGATRSALQQQLADERV